MYNKFILVYGIFFCITGGSGCLQNSAPTPHYSSMVVDGHEYVFILGSSSINKEAIVKVTKNCRGKSAKETIKKLGVPTSVAEPAINFIAMRKVVINIHREGNEDDIYATLCVNQAICGYGAFGLLDNSELNKNCPP